MSQIFSGGLWYEDHCLKITPFKKGGIRYQYPGEELVITDADSYSIDETVGCNFAPCLMKIEYVIQNSSNGSFKGIVKRIVDVGNRVLADSNQRFISDKNAVNTKATEIYTSSFRVRLINIQGNTIDYYYDATSGARLATPQFYRGFRDNILTSSIKISFCKTTGENQECGGCTFKLFKDGATILQLTKNVCPVVQEGSNCHLDQPEYLQSRTSPLGYIAVSNTEFNGDGTAAYEIPPHCIDIYQVIPTFSIGYNPVSNPRTNPNGVIWKSIGQYCSDEGCDPPTVEKTGENCPNLCPKGTCQVDCGEVICCYDTSTGKSVKSISKEDF